MDPVPSKSFLPPLNRALKLDNLPKNRGSSTRIRESRFSITPKQRDQKLSTLDNINFKKTDEGSEAVGMPLPPLSPLEQQPNQEFSKANPPPKVQSQPVTNILNVSRAKKSLPRSQKNPEVIIKSKKRVAVQDISREKVRGADERSKSQNPTASSAISKSIEAVRTLEEISDEDEHKIEEEGEEEDEKEIQEEELQPTEGKKKKKKGITLLKDMVPLNLEDERKKFFELNFEYDPQFEYKMEDRNQKFSEPHKAYLKIAETILDKCLKEFGDDEAYIEQTGGKLSTEEEITEQYTKYVKDLELENHLKLVFTDKIVSSASCLYKGKGKGAILISLPVMHREKRVLSLFHHEIGTHFVRKLNERQQQWAWYRKQYNLKSCLVIEEGLAMLNQTLDDAFDPEGRPYLFSAALHYYACYKASFLSLRELFKDLEKYIKDPIRRWKECIRVKRGVSDTSKPGGMYKDQVYLRGSIKILQNRTKIDFVLLHMGKLNLEDLQRMIRSGYLKTDKMKIPSFLRDIEKYKAALDRIASFNLIDNEV